MNWFEIIGFVTGLASVWLFARQNIWAWPVGLTNSASWLILFLQSGLYADSALQVVYIGLGAYGWWNWRSAARSIHELRVTFAPGRVRALLVVVAIGGTALVALLLDALTDSTVPLADAATTVLSLIATYLLAKKHIENWPLWIVGVNLPCVALYLYKGLVLTAALQPLFIALSVAGWLAWSRSMHAQTSRAGAAA